MRHLNLTYSQNVEIQKNHPKKNLTSKNSAEKACRDYFDGFMYEDGKLKMISMSEGYIDYQKGSPSWVFQYKDHLGNVRMTYADLNKDGKIDPDNEILSQKNYYPFGMTHKGYNNQVSAQANSVASKFLYNGKELEEDLGLELFDFGARRFDPTIGRWAGIDKRAEAYYPVSPYQYVLNNPVAHQDHNGEWTVSRHYYMTYRAVAAAGIGKKQARLIAHYSSVYADNPGSTMLAINNTIHRGGLPMSYSKKIDYSGTVNSQVTEWKGKGTNYNVWHSMRSEWETDNNKISAEEARQRGLRFGWGKIFESAKHGSLNELEANSKGIEAFGQGVHALQDADAHKGRHDVGVDHLRQDIFGDSSMSEKITESAVMVHNLLTENWDALDKSGGVKIINTEGLSSKQLSQIISQALKYLKQQEKKEDKK